MTDPENPPFIEAPEALARGLAFSWGPLACLPEPFRLTPPDLASFRRAAEAVALAAERMTEAFFERRDLRAYFGYSAERERFILRDPGYRPLIPLGRLDGFLTGAGPRFVEYNTDGTAGWHYATELDALWRERRGAGPPDPAPLSSRLLETLLFCFRQWDARGMDRPRIALADRPDVATRPEQDALAEAFSRAGFPTEVADPRSLVRRGGRLWSPKGPVDLVYRRLVSEEAFEDPAAIGGLLEAYIAGEVCVVGGFCTDPAWSKTLMAVCTDERWRDLFPEPLWKDLEACVPWTRKTLEGPVRFEGVERDLRRLLLEEKDRFLIKPRRSYDGQGLLAGPYAGIEEWRRAVEGALEREDCVAQVFLPSEPEHLEGFGDAVLQPGAFILLGRLAGFLPRYGRTEVLGGGRWEWYAPSEVEVPWQPPG